MGSFARRGVGLGAGGGAEGLGHAAEQVGVAEPPGERRHLQVKVFQGCGPTSMQNPYKRERERRVGLTRPPGERLRRVREGVAPEVVDARARRRVRPPPFSPLSPQNLGHVHPQKKGGGGEEAQEGDERLRVDDGRAAVARAAPLRGGQGIGDGELAT